MVKSSPVLLVERWLCPPGLVELRRTRAFRDVPGRVTVIVTQKDVEPGPSINLAAEEWVAMLEDLYPDDVVRLVRHTPEFPDSYQEAQVGELRVEWQTLDEEAFLERYRLDDVNPHSLTSSALSVRGMLKETRFDQWRYGQLRHDPETGLWRRLTERERGMIDGIVSALSAALVAEEDGFCPDPSLLPIVDERALTITNEVLTEAQSEYGWREETEKHHVLHTPPWKTELREFEEQVAPGTHTGSGQVRNRVVPGGGPGL